MGMKVAISHHNIYHYAKAVRLGPQVIRLRTAPHSRTKIHSYSLNIKPGDYFINWLQDPFGNYQARVVFPELVHEFRIQVEIIADLVAFNPFDFFLEESAQKFPFTYNSALKKELSPYLEITEAGQKLLSLYNDCKRFVHTGTVDFLVSLNQEVNRRIQYTIRMEPGVQSCEETLDKSLGSCRDSAWLMVNLLRHFGLASRFVSGYLVQLSPDEPEEVEKGLHDDFTDLHAWAEAYVPGAGWIGLDATSGLFAGEGHIPLACTPHFSSAAPITGLLEPVGVEFTFENRVERIQEDPRPTKPYSEQELSDILALGEEVDQRLEEADVRLTMGGEPTFISKGDMESDQWNTKADGKDKRQKALSLAKGLRSQFSKGGFIHFGQGKWYPGEAIPRWQYTLYWRKDQEPIWRNDQLIGDPNRKGSYTDADLKKFVDLLCDKMMIAREFALPAYEDKFYYLWEENCLPTEFDMQQELANEDRSSTLSIQRQTLLHLLRQGFEETAGYVLPLRWDYVGRGWQTCLWKFRRKHLFLLPGNSQMGLRLPQDRIDQVTEDIHDVVLPTDPIEQPDQLPSRKDLANFYLAQSSRKSSVASKTFTTALCLYLEHGSLHLFLPPLDEFEHFLHLIYVIETVAEQLHMAVVIEGYQPPFHKRVHKLVVAPDPGVIEVNIHPAQNWNELVKNYRILFSEAKHAGLSTNKFDIDGKHTGTGGGNHITLGGVRPEESPLLRRPDLLRSMLTFWQNHPSLSYLFASSFIGTTSQAPRLDEGRPDMIYELEIAFKELDKYKKPPFWLADRLFRNLLTDITGNTHRAEFCIDKLFNPESSTGRLGILELRGFDMPPHEHMSLVQLLLIRCLVSAFWDEPYRESVINWGTDLHDKFMLHHFVSEDIFEVVEYLRRKNIKFDYDWLRVFRDFRFPVYGSVIVNGVQLTLRGALEPWIVLGEEMTSSGTSRYVDSSIERLEVSVQDFHPERYLILCNGIEVPLMGTDQEGKWVAGIRYKAWAPHSALHPTIGVNSPLVFDVFDKWNNRSIGGCTYHVVHPGGRNYETFPVNPLEAEGRRASRFWDFNHSPKSNVQIAPQSSTGRSGNYLTPHRQVKEGLTPKKLPVSNEFPHTLDLRRS